MASIESILEQLSASENTSASVELNSTINAHDIDLQIRQEHLLGMQQDREQRKQFAMHIFTFVCIYMFVVLLIILAVGQEWVCFNIPESVLMMLLGTTTVNVIGVLVIVANYLFPKKIAQ